MSDIGKLLTGLGVLLILAGGIVFLLGKFPGLKSLPGDIVIKKNNFTFYFPLGTSILISILLSLLLLLWRKLVG